MASSDTPKGAVPAQRPSALASEPSQDTQIDKFALDGGFKAWMQVIGGFLVFFNIWGFPISYGAFQIFYELHYLESYSASAISWIGTTQGFLLIMVSVFGGPLYDLGYFRELVCIGSFFMVFGFMMLSLSTEYYQVFLAQGVCAGLGCGLLYVPTLALVGGAFRKNRAIAMGIVTSGVGLGELLRPFRVFLRAADGLFGLVGGVVYTIMFQQLLPMLHFSWTVRVMAFTALATFLLAIIFLLWIPGNLTTSAAAAKTPGKARALFDKTALTSPAFVAFNISQFLIYCAYIVPLFFIPVYGNVALGLSNEFTLWVLVISQATSLVGRLVTGLLAKYLGSMIVWTVCCAISGVLALTWLAVDDEGGFVTFAALYGFISGALVAMPPTVFPLVCPEPSKLGTRMGMSWAVTSISMLISSPIAGALIKGEGSKMNYTGMQAWSGALLMAGSASLGVLWIILVREDRGPDNEPGDGNEKRPATRRSIWI